MPKDSDRLRLSDDAAFQSYGPEGQAIILRLSNGQLYTANTTTRSLLEALDGRRTFAQAVDVVAREYEVDLAVLRADLTGMADVLLEEGLLLVVPEDGRETA